MRDKPTLRPRIFAHRGSMLLGPENTAQAFDIAIAYAADVLEIDVRISADDHVVVTHDENVNRTTDGLGAVRELPLTELKRLDAGYRTQSMDGTCHAGQGVRMITLDELLDHYRQVEVNIDIKDNDVRAARLVADTIDRHNRANDTTVASFHSKLLRQFRSFAPHIRTAAVRDEVARLYFSRLLPRSANSKKTALNYHAVQIPVSYKLIPLATRRFIETVSGYGKDICFWTVNDPEKMRQLLTMGATGLVTDRPDLALSVFQEMGFKP